MEKRTRLVRQPPCDLKLFWQAAVVLLSLILIFSWRRVSLPLWTSCHLTSSLLLPIFIFLYYLSLLYEVISPCHSRSSHVILPSTGSLLVFFSLIIIFFSCVSYSLLPLSYLYSQDWKEFGSERQRGNGQTLWASRKRTTDGQWEREPPLLPFLQFPSSGKRLWFSSSNHNFLLLAVDLQPLIFLYILGILCLLILIITWL